VPLQLAGGYARRSIALAEHVEGEALPGPRAVQGVVAAAVGLAGVLSAASAGSAGDHAADRAELHRLRRPSAVPLSTLVTLECTPLDIATSVSE
jgi:hypothetical protein